MSKYDVVGLFAGIGGLEIGFRAGGFKPSLLCELDLAASAVLRDRFRDVALRADVRDLTALPSSTRVLCAGFPCQDLSSVGQKQGIGGEQSSLVSEVFRLLSQRQVEWVVIENVPFMLHLHAGRAIEEIVAGLESLGYRWAYRVIDSQSFGLPQRRRRVFLVASNRYDPRPVLFPKTERQSLATQAIRWEDADAIGFYWTEGTYATGLAYNAVPPLKGGSTIGIPSPPAALLRGGQVITPHINDAERLQGFPAGWTRAAAAVTRESVRWKLIGNAVTTLAAKWIAKNIARQIECQREARWIQPTALRAGTWPDAAWGTAGTRCMVQLSSDVVRRRMMPLSEFLIYEPKPLSAKATNGFLSRAEKGNLFLPKGFKQRLRLHASRMSGS